MGSVSRRTALKILKSYMTARGRAPLYSEEILSEIVKKYDIDTQTLKINPKEALHKLYFLIFQKTSVFYKDKGGRCIKIARTNNNLEEFYSKTLNVCIVLTPVKSEVQLELGFLAPEPPPAAPAALKHATTGFNGELLIDDFLPDAITSDCGEPVENVKND